MINKIIESDLFLITFTIGVYLLSQALYRRTKLNILHPMLITTITVIAFLLGTKIEYSAYKESVGIFDFGLNMSVVALGYLMYEQMKYFKGRLLSILVSIVTGSFVGILSVVYIARAFGVDRAILTSIAPKSVTVPIAISIVEPLGGIVSITSVMVFATGIFGSIFGVWILRKVGVRDRFATGFALGSASHGIGTARAIELGAAEGALGGVAMALMGIITAILLPLIERLLY